MNDGDYPLIQESGWRWRLAQLFFKLIYQRDYMWFAPWKNGGFAAGVVVFYQRQVLLAQRAEHLAHPGMWGCPAGYMNLKNQETLAQTAVRETAEEIGISLDISKLTPHTLCHVGVLHGRDMPGIKDYSNICVYYWYELSDEEYAKRQESDEAYNLTLFDEAAFEKLVVEGKICAQDMIDGIRAAFKTYNQEKNI